MKSHFVFAVAALALAGTPLLAETDTPASTSTPAATAATSSSADKAPFQMVDTFFKSLEAGKVDQAYDQLLVGSKIAELSKDVSTLKTKTRDAIREFGDITGYESVSIKNVGTHLIRATYVSVGKDFPIRWRFYFYKTPEHWKLIDIRVDDRLADLFEEYPASDAESTR
jgi:hypothetical protein